MAQRAKIRLPLPGIRRGRESSGETRDSKPGGSKLGYIETPESRGKSALGRTRRS
jgi:hypothetical protein